MPVSSMFRKINDLMVMNLEAFVEDIDNPELQRLVYPTLIVNVLKDMRQWAINKGIDFDASVIQAKEQWETEKGKNGTK